MGEPLRVTVRRCVVVGDVIESRDLEDRSAFRQVLTDALAEANEAVDDGVAAPFATLKGVDEIAGVLETPIGSYRAIRTLVEAIHPAAIRFAVVWGDVDVGIHERDVARQDGPAFHRADELLETIAREDRYVEVVVPGVPGPYVTTIGNQMDLLCIRKSEWTARQAEVVREYRDAESMAATAERLDVAVQTISKSLARANAKRLMTVESDLETTIEYIATEVVE